MYRKLGEAREEIQDREYGATAQGVEDLVDAWDRDLGYVDDLVEFLVVYRYVKAAGFFWYADKRAEPWRSGVLDETRGDVRVQYGIALFG